MKNKKKITKLKIHIPIYDAILTIYLAKDFRRICDKYNMTEEISESEAMAFKYQHKKTLAMCYGAAFRPDVRMSFIVHECVHLVNMIFTDRGIKLDQTNDETQAYFTEYLFEQVYNFLDEELNKGKTIELDKEVLDGIEKGKLSFDINSMCTGDGVKIMLNKDETNEN